MHNLETTMGNFSRLIATAAVILCSFQSTAAISQKDQEPFRISSPDQKITVTIAVGKNIQFSVAVNGQQVLVPSTISLQVKGEGTLGRNPKLKRTSENSVRDIIKPVVQQKSASVPNNYNELTLHFAQHFDVTFRAYNDGIAYRYATQFDDSMTVSNEQLEYNFAGDYDIYFPEEESFMTHQERKFKHLKLSNISSDSFSSLPALVEVNDGPKLLLGQSDLQDYPGYYLEGTSSPSLKGIWPAVATKEILKDDRNFYVTERANYIAQTSGTRTLPWRFIGVAEDDTDLITNQMVYKLADSLKIEDPSWIEPGKVAWDWWNANNVYNVDFRAGVNTETYKHYIDFAAQMELEYINLDEGWYELGDVLSVNPNIDIPELVAYGKKKDVDIILWVVWKTLEDQFDAALEQFSKWGVKGMKIDFMQRDDQWVVNWYRKVAKEAAKHKLLVNFHGSYTPAGLRRPYPNVISREGVKGLENNKWAETVTPKHDVTLPFTRMATGPMDYTPGAMINAQPKNFKPISDRPMSQGTRVHQLAMYVVYESPLQMLADSPTHYLKQKQDLLDYLSAVPTTWDETHVLKGEIGDYIAIARRKGDTWYIGAMTDGNARDLSLDLSFLDKSSYKATIFKDGINANRYGSDYESVTQKINPAQNIKIHLAPGGGWVAVIK
jgi:alpha-glucosidase